MASIILRVLVQLALTLAALLGAQYSLFNWLTGSTAAPADPVRISALGLILLEGTKQQVELNLRLVVTIAALALLFVHEAVAYWVPKRNLLEFRKEYIDLERDDWRKRLHSDIRINLMYAKRRWYTLWLIPCFEWTWNDGFKPHHEDANMWMCVFQGVCGQAYRRKTVKFASFSDGAYSELKWSEKWCLLNRYHLTKRQLRKARHLRAVLSIPIVKRTSGLSPVFKRVGVINLDTDSSEAAAQLEENQQELADFFTRFGKILAELKA